MNDSTGAFDRRLTLAELLPAATRERAWPALVALLGEDLALLDAQGALLAGNPPAPDWRKVAVLLEIEPVAYLAAAGADAARLRAGATLLAAIVGSQARYRMAADLHTETVAADYRELQLRHEALLESEARYRDLAASLERRVAEQVAVIDERQRQLYQAEKLASIGHLAAGVAHEINNPVGFMRSNLGTAQRYLDDLKPVAALIGKGQAAEAAAAWRACNADFILDDLRELLAECIGGADRIARIVRDLRGFSSIDRPEEAIVDLNDTLSNACRIFAAQLPPGIRIEQSLRPLPPLMCLPGHLSQVFLNLLSNAAQSIQGEGVIGVSSQTDTQAGAQAIVVRISDTGVGIPEEMLSRVFDPFFTTRDVGQGTGLGLTVARDIVQVHGGRIAIDSVVGAGSTVTVTIPT